MTTPHQSVLAEDARSNCRAFLRIVPADRETCAGALLFINSRAEPLEFTYSRVSVKHRRLSRERDLGNAVPRELQRAGDVLA